MATIDIIARLQNQASAGAQALAKDIGDVGKVAASSDKDIKRLNDIVGSGLQIATGLAVGGLAAMGAGLAYSISQAAEAELAQAALARTVESTGMAAGLTVPELNAMAGGLQAVTTYGDETISRAQSLLLTFTNLKEDVFPQTTELALDMATVFGSVDAAAVGLGKALNDFDGFTALKRQGVSFSETQLEQIKLFKETNDLASYQTLVLGTLAEQFGGQARAAAETFTGSWKQLNNTIGEGGEIIGGVFLPVATKVFGAINDAANNALPGLTAAFEDLEPVLNRLADDSLPGIADAAALAVNQIALMAQSSHWELLRQEFMDSGGNILEYYEVLDGATQRFDLFRTAADIEQDMATGELAIRRLELAIEANNEGLEIGTQEFFDYVKAQEVAAVQSNILNVEIQEGETFFQALARAEEEAADWAENLTGAYDYLIPKTEEVTTSTQATSGAYDYMIGVAIRTENRMGSYGERLGEVDEAQDDTTESAQRMAHTLSTAVLDGMGRAADIAGELYDAYGELEEASGEWVVTTRNNTGQIATLHEQLMTDLDEETKRGYQEILNTAAEGSAEWLAAYQALQGDLTASQRTEIVARIADLQAGQGESIQIYTGDAEAAEEQQERIAAAYAAQKESHRTMVLDILVQQAQLEGGFTTSQANIMVAMGLMTQAEADIRLESQETARQVGAVGEALIKTFLEDGSISRSEAALLEEAIAGVETGAFTAGEVIGAMARDGLGAFIGQADTAWIAADRFLQKVEETEGDYQVNIHTNYTQSGEPPPGYNGGQGGGQGAGGGATGGGGADFDTGGFTGYGPSNQIAGRVHFNEYVLNPDAVNRIGLGNLEAMNNGGAIGGGSAYVDNRVSVTVYAPGATSGTAAQIRREVESVMAQYNRTSSGQGRMR